MNQILVIFCKGNAPSAVAAHDIACEVSKATDTPLEEIELKHFDSDSIAKAVVGSAKTIQFKSPVNQDEEVVAAQQAAILITEKYKDEIRSNNELAFAFALQQDVSGARSRMALNPAFAPDEDVALLKAVKIVSEDKLSTVMALDYGLTKGMIDVVKFVATHHMQLCVTVHIIRVKLFGTSPKIHGIRMLSRIREQRSIKKIMQCISKTLS